MPVLSSTVWTAIISTVVTAVVTFSARQVWRFVLRPIGEAAKSISRLATAIADAQLIPEMNSYLHQRMHDLLAELSAIRLAQSTFPHELDHLGQTAVALRRVADDLTAVADRLREVPPL